MLGFTVLYVEKILKKNVYKKHIRFYHFLGGRTYFLHAFAVMPLIWRVAGEGADSRAFFGVTR